MGFNLAIMHDHTSIEAVMMPRMVANVKMPTRKSRLLVTVFAVFSSLTESAPGAALHREICVKYT